MSLDEQNLGLSTTPEAVDRINAGFYGRFPYPWRPMQFESLADPDLGARLVDQAIGDFDHRTVPPDGKIWVTGCGTNQAVYTALRFPRARVLGSDISDASLDLCRHTAEDLGLSNLTLRRESLNAAEYRDRFDYVLCTGVIHHNADPPAVLERIGRTLLPGGILELMVYNRFHCVASSAVQKAIRLLGGPGPNGEPDFERDLALAHRLVHGFPGPPGAVAELLGQYRGTPETMLADRLFQPVEHSYTVASLAAMAQRAGLEILVPCLNQFDQAKDCFSWEIELGDPVLQETYDALEDLQRWQVTNLLLHERSPHLWFYLQRSDSPRRRKTMREICNNLLEQEFIHTRTMQRSYIRDAEGAYHLSERTIPYPATVPDPAVRAVYDAVGPGMTMREAFRRTGLSTDLRTVERVRLRLTTPAFPFLESRPAEEGGRLARRTAREATGGSPNTRARLARVEPKPVLRPGSDRGDKQPERRESGHQSNTSGG